MNSYWPCSFWADFSAHLEDHPFNQDSMLHSNISHTWAATVWHGPSLPSNMNIWRVWLISSHSCFLAPESPACSSCFHSDYLGYFCCIVIGLENERLESWILIPWWECLFLTWDVRLAWSFLIFHGSLQFASGSVHGISHKRDGFLVEEGNIPGKFCPTAIKKKKGSAERAVKTCLRWPQELQISWCLGKFAL